MELGQVFNKTSTRKPEKISGYSAGLPGKATSQDTLQSYLRTERRSAMDAIRDKPIPFLGILGTVTRPGDWPRPEAFQEWKLLNTSHTTRGLYSLSSSFFFQIQTIGNQNVLLSDILS